MPSKSLCAVVTKRSTWGEAKPGEDTEHKIVTACTYYKLTVDGQEIIEIDTLGA